MGIENYETYCDPWNFEESLRYLPLESRFDENHADDNLPGDYSYEGFLSRPEERAQPRSLSFLAERSPFPNIRLPKLADRITDLGQSVQLLQLIVGTGENFLEATEHFHECEQEGDSSMFYKL